MQSTLQFNLPEDEEAFLTAVKAPHLLLAVIDTQTWISSLEAEQREEISVEEVKQTFQRILSDNHVYLQDFID